MDLSIVRGEFPSGCIQPLGKMKNLIYFALDEGSIMLISLGSTMGRKSGHSWPLVWAPIHKQRCALYHFSSIRLTPYIVQIGARPIPQEPMVSEKVEYPTRYSYFFIVHHCESRFLP